MDNKPQPDSNQIAALVAIADAIRSDTAKIAYFDNMGILTGWSTSSFGTTETTLGSTSVVIPPDCNKVLLLGSIRMQSLAAGTIDMFARVRYDGSTLSPDAAFTSTATYNGASVSLIDVMNVSPGTRTFDLRARTASSSGQSPSGKILIIPLKA